MDSFIVQDYISNSHGDNKFFISTVELNKAIKTMDALIGIPSADYQYETMVFDYDVSGQIAYGHILDCDRYYTEDEAVEGHHRMIEKWRDRI